MRCSNCSEFIKPIVAVDIDGTLGDYHGHFIEFAEQYVGRELRRAWEYRGSYGFRAWFNDSCGIGTEEYRAIKLAYRQGGMKRSMPIFDGARALCWAIQDAEAELWLTTTRPYLSLDNIVPDTVEWLRRHEIEYDGMLFDEDKYARLAERVDTERVVAVLDDLPEMIHAAGKVLYWGHDAPILISGRYNSAARNVLMCDLDSASDVVLARIQDWKKNHA
jgi:phosphoglycolate phosphatase-like HAD superfamily hydrolase